MRVVDEPFKFVRIVESIQQRLIPLLFFCPHPVNNTCGSLDVFLRHVMAAGTGCKQSCPEADARGWWSFRHSIYNRLNAPFKFVRIVESIQQRLIPLLFFCPHPVNNTCGSLVERYRQNLQKVYVFLRHVMAAGTGCKQSCPEADGYQSVSPVSWAVSAIGRGPAVGADPRLDPGAICWYRQNLQKVYVFLRHVMAAGTGCKQSCPEADARGKASSSG
jgi:hypothetical protein